MNELEILKEKAAKLSLCSKWNTKPVMGDGPPDAKVVFVGEAPGRFEEKEGKPFVGLAGKFLVKELEKIGLRREEVYITNVVKCLHGFALVKTREGNKRLDWIVKTRWAGEVQSVNRSGALVWRRIVGWHRAPLASRALYKVSLLDGKRNPKGTVGFVATNDHPILTKRGWIRIEDLNENDLIATGTPAPGPRAKQLLFGSLLGDAGINAGCLGEAHSSKQENYLLMKAGVLSEFCPNIKAFKSKAQNGLSYPAVRMFLPKSHYFHELERIWYPSGKKNFPLEAIRQLDNLGLSVWYMDDGYWRRKATKDGKSTVAGSAYVEIALGDIPEATAMSIPGLFRERGFETYARFVRTWRLFFRYKEGIRFLRQIAPYIPPSMRYKIPEELHGIPFRAKAYEKEAVQTHWKPAVKCLFQRRPSTVYCIDVEGTSNFVTPGGVVHNCRPPDNRKPKPEEVKECMHLLEEELRLIRPKVIVLLGDTAVKAVLDKSYTIGKNHGQLIRKNGCGFMIMPHPSAAMRFNKMRVIFKADMDVLKELLK